MELIQKIKKHLKSGIKLNEHKKIGDAALSRNVNPKALTELIFIQNHFLRQLEQWKSFGFSIYE